MVNKQKDTNNKAEVKAKNKRTKTIQQKKDLKNIEIDNEVLEIREGVRTNGGLPSTYTKTQLRTGTVKETYGERR
jgi:hypothetical protein